ncbi:hypothetical protein [Candidatus Methanoperedens nitratireducens]|uniref:hypothetical protein n=1 Tax=Candidatus Methanoperedens nitratireducens TaxID=1392998 RepID=UPI0012FEB48A|nr:hypothetical protein [Candidatus Methanoperedens nitroreducens]
MNYFYPEHIEKIIIATHFSYASIIPYSHDREGDLSSVHNITEFAAEMRKIAQESMRWW